MYAFHKNESSAADNSNGALKGLSRLALHLPGGDYLFCSRLVKSQSVEKKNVPPERSFFISAHGC